MSHNTTSSRYNPVFTQNVIDNIGPKVDDRTRLVMGSLIRHIHDFAREVDLTTDEWMAGVHFVNSIGQISTPIRNEGQRISDVLGLESYVFQIPPSQLSTNSLSVALLTRSHTPKPNSQTRSPHHQQFWDLSGALMPLSASSETASVKTRIKDKSH
jgi:Catechol dioxygenase N terminus